MKTNEQKRKQSGAAAFKKLTPHGWKKTTLVHQSERHPSKQARKKSRKSVTLLYTTIIAEVF